VDALWHKGERVADVLTIQFSMRFNVSFFREIKLSVMFCIVVCLVVLVFSPSAAVAQGEEEVKLMPTESKDKPLSVEENWYGWKILISGGSSLAVPF
jgi:hypothetical protein